MQYPIIDLITSAYINNGWTGLDVIDGKNLLQNNATSSTIQGVEFIINENKSITANGTSTGWDGLNVSTFILPAGNYVLSSGVPSSEQYNLYVEISTLAISTRSGNKTFTITADTNITSKIYARPGYNLENITIYPQIEKGNTASPYVPYHPPKTDIFSRLKLPLPNYFPHPVIDSLKRASDGTMTNKDREILTHYLTPLGIGGI